MQKINRYIYILKKLAIDLANFDRQLLSSQELSVHVIAGFPSSNRDSFKRYSSNCFPCNSSRGRSRFLSGTAIRNDETEVCRWQGGQRFRHHRRFEYHEEMKQKGQLLQWQCRFLRFHRPLSCNSRPTNWTVHGEKYETIALGFGFSFVELSFSEEKILYDEERWKFNP